MARLTFFTKEHTGKSDVLLGVANETLSITDLAGVEIIRIHPVSGPWTHEKLRQISESLEILDVLKNGANAYLGNALVGSTEISSPSA